MRTNCWHFRCKKCLKISWCLAKFKCLINVTNNPLFVIIDNFPMSWKAIQRNKAQDLTRHTKGKNQRLVFLPYVCLVLPASICSLVCPGYKLFHTPRISKSFCYSYLDWNFLFADLATSILLPFQVVRNYAARLLYRCSKLTHIIPFFATYTGFPNPSYCIQTLHFSSSIVMLWQP